MPTMKNTFTGAVMSFQNDGIYAITTEIITLRIQLAIRREKLSESGWNDALNNFMLRSLERIGATVKAVTYHPNGPDPEELRVARLADAQDRTRTLGDAYADFGLTHINSDDIVMGTSVVDHTIDFDLSGVNPDIPQPTPDMFPNDWFRLFLIKLDGLLVEATNCDSRTQPTTINAYESAQLLSTLSTLYNICMQRGGEYNRIETPTGVRKSNYDETYNSDGSKDVDWTDDGTREVEAPVGSGQPASSAAPAAASPPQGRTASPRQPQPIRGGR